MSKKLKNIMEMKKGDKEVALLEYLKNLGGSIDGVYTTRGKLKDETVARIINLERSNREEGLWKIAFISAIASTVSALAALAAVFYGILN